MVRACGLNSLDSVLFSKTQNLGQGFKQKKAFPKHMSAYENSVYGNINYELGIIQLLTLQEEKVLDISRSYKIPCEVFSYFQKVAVIPCLLICREELISWYR